MAFTGIELGVLDPVTSRVGFGVGDGLVNDVDTQHLKRKFSI